MTIERQQIGDAVEYRGFSIIVRRMGPDLLCYVGDSELSAFYLNSEAAVNGGKRYIDQILKEKEKRQ